MKKNVNSGFSDWRPSQLPALAGKTYAITGGNSGIGFEAAKMLAAAGGAIVIAARNPSKARDAVETLAKKFDGPIESLELDLADLSSVRRAADELHRRFDKIDGLINNAGIMQTPPQKTVDGFEMQLGTNHLGHFLWTGLCLDLVEKAAGRVVTVSSVAHRYGRMDFDDLMLTKNYTPTRAYCQSKLANLLFMLELHRRLSNAGAKANSYACHPGYADTRLQSTGPTGALRGLYLFTNKLIAQSARSGAIPTVLCAAGSEALPGAYYGPQGLGGARGRVSDAAMTDAARNQEDAARLWQESEKLVGFSWGSP